MLPRPTRARRRNALARGLIVRTTYRAPDGTQSAEDQRIEELAAENGVLRERLDALEATLAGLAGESDAELEAQTEASDGGADAEGPASTPTVLPSGGQVRKVVGEIEETDGGIGVHGHNTADSRETYGVWGEVDSEDGYGLYTPDDARVDGSLQFTADSPPNVYLFESGATNPEQYVVSHSPSYPGWGLKYVDDGDSFVFHTGAGGLDPRPVFSIGLETWDVSVDNGSLDVDGDVTVGGAVSQDVSTSVGTNGGQEIADSTETRIDYEFENANPRNEFDLSNNKFVCAADGDYHVDVQARWFSNTFSDGDSYVLSLHAGGKVTEAREVHHTSTPTISLSRTMVDLSSGDEIYATIEQWSGTSQNLTNSTWLTVTQVG